MRALSVKQSVWIAPFLVFSAWAAADGPPARPGKGMSMIPGDYAEYTNTQFVGERKTTLPSTIMVAIGKVEGLQGVTVFSVSDGKLISKKDIFYDLTRAKVEQGELLETGKETLTINGKKCECTWERRRNQNVVGTFWRSPDMPFEKLAKVQMEADDGRKMITELVLFGPDLANEKGTQEFLKRLKELSAQDPVKK